MKLDKKSLVWLIYLNLALILLIGVKGELSKNEKDNNPSSSIPMSQPKNGSQPYADWFGYNHRPEPDIPQSIIAVKASTERDVVVIIRYNNSYKNVAGHLYIRSGEEGKIYVTPGNSYQVFFYSGNDWSRTKKIRGELRGGFTRNEYTSKDPEPHYFNIKENNDEYIWDGGISYDLNKQRFGNFKTKNASMDDVFYQP